jgi:hypothetical protein
MEIMGMVNIMGLFLMGAILLLVWLWFAVQEPDCEELRRRPPREYVESAPLNPAKHGGRQPQRIIVSERPLTRREVERVREVWGSDRGRYGGVVVWDGDGFREEIGVWKSTR